MDMIPTAAIVEAGLTDWRKLAQGLHARYLAPSFAEAARFVTALDDIATQAGHWPRVTLAATAEGAYVDLMLVSDDAIYRDDDGSEIVVQWVTQRDLDLAERLTTLAAELGLRPDPAAVAHLELGLDTGQSAVVAPVWAALLAGDPGAQGRGTPSDEIRDGTGRVPNLWFDDPDGERAAEQRWHVEVYVAPEAAAERLAAALAAGGTIVDDSEAPALVVIADQDGNRGILCAPGAQSA